MGETVAVRGRDTLAFVSVTAFAVCMYTVPGEWVVALGPLHLALLTSGAAAAFMLVGKLSRREGIAFDGVRGGALLCLGVLALASMSWALDPEMARGTALDLLKSIAIYFTMVNVITTPKRLVIFSGVMILASIATSLGVINWYRTGIDLVEGFRARWVGVYADPNHMAMDMGIVVPISVAFITRKQTRWWARLLFAIAGVLAVVAIVFSHSRGGFIGLCAGMAVWAFREKRRLQAIALAAALAVGLAVFAPESFWTRNETVTSFHEDASAMGRVYAWNVASKISSDKPLLGVGAGGFRNAWPIYAPIESHKSYVAHNVYLDVIGELGFIGLLFFLLFTGGAAGGAFAAAADKQIGWLARAISGAIAGYILCDLISGYFLSAHFYVLLGLGAAADRIARWNAGEERMAVAAPPSMAGLQGSA